MTDFWTAMSQHWSEATWSTWVIVIICINYGSILFLFLWAPWVKIPEAEDGTTGHVWSHGKIRENLHPLPLWWLIISSIGFISAAFYLVRYPAFGAYPGTAGWTSYQQMQEHLSKLDAQSADLWNRIENTSILDLDKDPNAMHLGQRLFDDNCAACHGYDAKGNKIIGAPNLTDNIWLYGGTTKKVVNSITHGRHGVMPAWSGTLRYGEIKNVASYVRGLSGLPHNVGAAKVGKPIFEKNCSVCHGADGEGKQLLGAANLTDDFWKYGGSMEHIMHTIEHGRKGHMPSWGDRLSDREIRVIAAWVFSHDNTKAALAASDK